MNPVKLTDTPFLKKLQMFSFALIGIGAIGTAVAFFTDAQRALAGYVVAFSYVFGLGVTGMFFSALQYAVRAGWSAAVRRIAELFAESIWLIIVGFLPIIFPRLIWSSLCLASLCSSTKYLRSRPIAVYFDRGYPASFSLF